MKTFVLEMRFAVKELSDRLFSAAQYPIPLVNPGRHTRTRRRRDEKQRRSRRRKCRRAMGPPRRTPRHKFNSVSRTDSRKVLLLGGLMRCSLT